MKHIAITLSLLAIAMIPLRGGDWYDGGLWQAMYMHSWSAGHDLPKNAWIIYIRSLPSVTNHLRHSIVTRPWQAPTMSHYTRVLVPSTNRTATRKCSPSLPKYVRSTRI